MRIFGTLVFFLAPPAIALAVVLVLDIALTIPALVIFVALVWVLHKGLVKWRRRQPDDNILPDDREARDQLDRNAVGQRGREPEAQPDHEAAEIVGPEANLQHRREVELQADFTDLKFFLQGSAVALFVVFISTATLATVGVLGKEFAYWMMGILVAGFVTLVSLGIFIVWVLPIHLYLYRKNRTGMGWYIFASFPPSIGFLLAYQPWNHEITSAHIRSAWACVLVGVCAALTFWYFSVHRRQEVELGAQDSDPSVNWHIPAYRRQEAESKAQDSKQNFDQNGS